MRYAIQNINAWSAFKFGGVIGAMLSVFPGLITGLTLRWLVRALRTWLESWLSLDIPLIGSYSLLDVVRLNDFLASLQQWDDRGWLLVLSCLLLAVLVGGLLTAVLSALAAAVYNLVAAFSGGIIVYAETLDGPYASLKPAAPMAVPTMMPAGVEAAAWLTAQATQHRWPIHPEETRIGSGPDNQVRLNGLAVNHAAIRWENGRFILHDLSGGHTWVNGRALIGPNMIKDGFQIRLANQEFLFQSS